MTATVTGELGTVYEVGSGLYSYVQPDGSWCINTSAFVVGAESVTMIDTCATERRTRALLEAIRATTDVPVGVLVLTYHHIDHVNGNGLVGARTIFGHDRCRARMLKPSEPPPANHIDPVEWGAIDPVPPDVTFTDRLDLWRDAGRIELRHVGRRAHTDNDVLVWVPDERVLFTGDVVMHWSTPMAVDGSVRGILETLREILALEPAVVVPGHGDVGGIELVHEQIRYYELIWRVAGAACDAGTTPLEAARSVDTGEFSSLLDGERLVANLHRAMAEMRDAEVTQLPMGQVFDDMVAFKGGPLRCVA